MYIIFIATRKIGETGCAEDTDCYDLKSYCDKTYYPYTCKCAAGFQGNSDGTKCERLTTVYIGNSCSNSFQCGGKWCH